MYRYITSSAYVIIYNCGPLKDVGCRARGRGLSLTSCSGCLFLFGGRSTKSLSSLSDVMTTLGEGPALLLADPVACIYQ
jgi:hypothetical protein